MAAKFERKYIVRDIFSTVVILWEMFAGQQKGLLISWKPLHWAAAIVYSVLGLNYRIVRKYSSGITSCKLRMVLPPLVENIGWDQRIVPVNSTNALMRFARLRRLLPRTVYSQHLLPSQFVVKPYTRGCDCGHHNEDQSTTITTRSTVGWGCKRTN